MMFSLLSYICWSFVWFLWQNVFRSFDYFLIRLIAFIFFILSWKGHIFKHWTLILIRYVLQRFLPFCGLPFNFVDCSHCWTELFTLMYSNLFLHVLFVEFQKTHCPDQGAFPLCFLFAVLKFQIFHLGL